MVSVAPTPWDEIGRVAQRHRCACLLLGLSDLNDDGVEGHLEDLISSLDCDVAILRAPHGWKLTDARRILVPIGGHGSHDELRARLLGSLLRTHDREVEFLRVLPQTTSPRSEARARRRLARMARDKAPGIGTARIVRSDEGVNEVVTRTASTDLLVLGLQHVHRRRKIFGEFALQVTRQSHCPVVLLSQEGEYAGVIRRI